MNIKYYGSKVKSFKQLSNYMCKIVETEYNLRDTYKSSLINNQKKIEKLYHSKVNNFKPSSWQNVFEFEITDNLFEKNIPDIFFSNFIELIDLLMLMFINGRGNPERLKKAFLKKSVVAGVLPHMYLYDLVNVIIERVSIDSRKKIYSNVFDMNEEKYTEISNIYNISNFNYTNVINNPDIFEEKLTRLVQERLSITLNMIGNKNKQKCINKESDEVCYSIAKASMRLIEAMILLTKTIDNVYEFPELYYKEALFMEHVKVLYKKNYFHDSVYDQIDEKIFDNHPKNNFIKLALVLHINACVFLIIERNYNYTINKIYKMVSSKKI